MICLSKSEILKGRHIVRCSLCGKPVKATQDSIVACTACAVVRCQDCRNESCAGCMARYYMPRLEGAFRVAVAESNEEACVVILGESL